MTPTPDTEPIREGLARELREAAFAWAFYGQSLGQRRDRSEVPLEVLADACLTYLIKRQAFHSDAYAVIKKEGLGR